jgi:hypothetical protein
MLRLLMKEAQQRRSDLLAQVEAVAAKQGMELAGPDHPVYQDRSFMIRSVRLQRRLSPTRQTGDSSPTS